MEIYTSYFGQLRNIDKQGYLAISIATYPPKWFTGLTIREFAPNPKWLKMGKGAYYKRLNYKLQQLDRKEILQMLRRLSAEKPIVLCCYEKELNECHRKRIAEWIYEQFEIRVEEFIPVKIEKKPDAVQASLF